MSPYQLWRSLWAHHGAFKPEKLYNCAHKLFQKKVELPDGSQGTFQLNGWQKIIRHYSLRSSGSRSMPAKNIYMYMNFK